MSRHIHIIGTRLRCTIDPRTPRLREAGAALEEKIREQRAWMARPRTMLLFGSAATQSSRAC